MHIKIIIINDTIILNLIKLDKIKDRKSLNRLIGPLNYTLTYTNFISSRQKKIKNIPKVQVILKNVPKI